MEYKDFLTPKDIRLKQFREIQLDQINPKDIWEEFKQKKNETLQEPFLGDLLILLILFSPKLTFVDVLTIINAANVILDDEWAYEKPDLQQNVWLDNYSTISTTICDKYEWTDDISLEDKLMIILDQQVFTESFNIKKEKVDFGKRYINFYMREYLPFMLAKELRRRMLELSDNGSFNIPDMPDFRGPRRNRLSIPAIGEAINRIRDPLETFIKDNRLIPLKKHWESEELSTFLENDLDRILSFYLNYGTEECCIDSSKEHESQYILECLNRALSEEESNYKKMLINMYLLYKYLINKTKSQSDGSATKHFLLHSVKKLYSNVQN